MDTNEKLKSFDDNKLIDIVKNYRQYGYGDDIRNTAINILESRGVDLDILKLRGDLVNTTYDDAKQELKSFENSSKFAFVLYGLLLILTISISFTKNIGVLQIGGVTLFWILFIGFFIFLIKSFIHQSKYYELIGKKEIQLNPILYFSAGVVIYIVMYFVFRKQIRDDINEIR
jgi:hypothetical protein